MMDEREDGEQPITVKREQFDSPPPSPRSSFFPPSQQQQQQEPLFSGGNTQPTEPSEPIEHPLDEVKVRSLEELYRDANMSTMTWQHVDLDFQDKDAPDKEDFEDIFKIFQQAKEINKVKVQKLAAINNELRNYNERLNDASGKNSSASTSVANL